MDKQMQFLIYTVADENRFINDLGNGKSNGSAFR